jgi:hypothetical protein
VANASQRSKQLVSNCPQSEKFTSTAWLTDYSTRPTQHYFRMIILFITAKDISASFLLLSIAIIPISIPALNAGEMLRFGELFCFRRSPLPSTHCSGSPSCPLPESASPVAFTSLLQDLTPTSAWPAPVGNTMSVLLASASSFCEA